MRKEEKEARRLVRERSGGVCEICSQQRAVEWHHRRNRSQGGPWSASNGLHLCSECHRYITEHPVIACGEGWAVRSWDDERTVPVYLSGRYVLLDDKGSYTTAEVPSDA